MPRARQRPAVRSCQALHSGRARHALWLLAHADVGSSCMCRTPRPPAPPLARATRRGGAIAPQRAVQAKAGVGPIRDTSRYINALIHQRTSMQILQQAFGVQLWQPSCNVRPMAARPRCRLRHRLQHPGALKAPYNCHSYNFKVMRATLGFHTPCGTKFLGAGQGDR